MSTTKLAQPRSSGSANRLRLIQVIANQSAMYQSQIATNTLHDSALPTVGVIYQVPKAELFQRFARQVGEQLAKRHGDDQYCDQGVVDGLANFLKIVCELLVKQLNDRDGSA